MSRQAAERGTRVEAWLAEGGTVLASTERARRSLVAAHAETQRHKNLQAWPTPAIFSWDMWVRKEWAARDREGLVLLNTVQEQALWTRTIRANSAGLTLPQTAQITRLASAAMQAHRLLADYAPRTLRASARAGWGEEAAIFSGWLADFEAVCQREGLVASCRLTLLLTAMLGEEAALQAPPGQNPESGPKLLLAGFDRLLETQTALLNAWGHWEHLAPEDAESHPIEPRPAAQNLPKASFWAARDADSELSACVQWLRNQRRANPQAQLLVVTTGLERRRGEIERALLRTSARTTGSDADPEKLAFEFTLGVPLAGVGIARAALLVLRWLASPIAEAELDWLISSGYTAAGSDEELMLAEAMLAARRHGAERPDWPLDAFLAQLEQSRQGSTTQAGNEPASESAGWAARIAEAHDMLRLAPARQSPLDWAELTGQLLETAGWPGFRPLGSTAFQARKGFAGVVETCASLGLSESVMGGSAMDWPSFVAALQTAAASTIFAAESTDAAVLITGPLESAGLLADGIWFLGADEQSWPSRGQPHPFLPAGLQRDTGMPHSSNEADWQLARQATLRLLASTDGAGENVVFSFARHAGENEARPSRLVVQVLGPGLGQPLAMPVAMPDELALEANATAAQTEWFEDASRPGFESEHMAGGSATLSHQSNCPFQAFATARLATQDWEPAQPGLSPRQRGLLLHGVLRRIWGGDGTEPGAIRTSAELNAIPDLPSFVRGFVDLTIRESFLPGRRSSLPDRFPPRLLAIEADRLTRLVSEWLAYEQQRLPFSVDGTEIARAVTVAGLTVNLRLDRVDSVSGGKLIIDYKTGTDTPKAWEGDRPESVQLPLYATHAVSENVEGLRVEGIVFARVKAGDVKFYGRVRDAAATLQADLKGAATLVKNPLTDDQLEQWRLKIEQLGEDFKSGHAEVDPRDGLKTCKNCHLHAVCRVYENLNELDLDTEDDSTEAEGDGDA